MGILTATATLIRTTDTTLTTGRTTTVGRHFIGTMVTATIRATIDTIITGTGTKLKTPNEIFEAGG